MKFLILTFLACASVASAFNLGSFVSGLFNNGPLAQYKDEIDGFKHLADLIKQKKSTPEIIGAVVQLNLQDKIEDLCKISFLQKLAPVQQACNVVVPLADQIASVASLVAPHRAKRGFNFGNFVNGVLNSGPLAQYKSQIDGFKQLASLIQQHKSTPEILQAVVGLHLESTIADLCKISFLQSLEPVQQTCSVVVPALDQLATVASLIAPHRVKRGFNFGNLLNGVLNSGPLAQYKTQIDGFKQLASLIQQHKSTPEILQAVVGLHLEDTIESLCKISFLQTLQPVQQVCGVVVPALDQLATVASLVVPHRMKRGFNFGNIFNSVLNSGPLAQYKTQIDGFKQLASLIQQHKSTPEILQAVVGLHLEDTIESLCKISFLQTLQPVQQVCGVVVPALDQLATVASLVVPHRMKRGFNFGNIFNSVLNSGPLAQYKTQIDGFKQLAEVIKQHKSTPEIIQAVVNLNLQDTIEDLCKISFLQTLQPVQQVCGVVVPLADQLANVAQLAPTLLG